MRLAAEDDLLVVGEAADIETALEQGIFLCPDVAIIDRDMLSIDGISMARLLHAACPQTQMILISMHDDPQARAQAEAAGAVAFLAKSMPAETLLKTIRQVSL